MEANGQAQRIVAFPSKLGWFALRITGRTLTALTFGRRTKNAAIVALKIDGVQPATPNRFESELIERFESYSAGHEDNFWDVTIDTSNLTPFAERVVHHCRRIDFGETLSYGEMAAKAGSPGAARAVGNIMAKNRFPLVVPCHRVVGSGKSLGGYSAPDGLKMKRRLLAMEGSLDTARPQALCSPS